ncbi:MAG: hypothetical protein ACRCYY_03260 [Trueperaceae bacterium]
MKLKGLRISREAKILFGLLFLAAAALIWVNLFINREQSFGGLFGNPPEATLAPSSPNESPDVVAPTAAIESAEAALTASADTTLADATPVVTPTVVAVAPTAARDVQLAELPFLVTEAPVSPTSATAEEVTATARATRPGEQRATINPFSPIVLAPVETTQVANNNLVEVAIPDEPAGISTVDADLANGVRPVEDSVAEGPLPEAVLPKPTVASLPRALPGIGSPVTPDLLRNMSRSPVAGTIGASSNTGVTVTIREPGQVTPTVRSTLSASAENTDDMELEPLGSVGAGSADGVNTSSLSSYLRNNEVRFTGYAVGPVSVGIFRSKMSSNPINLIIGQPLPETEFVLTSLQGKEAEFSDGQEKQLLTLDLRR